MCEVLDFPNGYVSSSLAGRSGYPKHVEILSSERELGDGNMTRVTLVDKVIRYVKFLRQVSRQCFREIVM